MRILIPLLIFISSLAASPFGWQKPSTESFSKAATHADGQYVCRAESRDAFTYGKVIESLSGQQVCKSWGQEHKNYQVYVPLSGADNVLLKKKEEYTLEITVLDEKGLLFSMGIPAKLTLADGSVIEDTRPRSSRAQGAIYTSYRFFHLESPPSGGAVFQVDQNKITLQSIENQSSQARKMKARAKLYPAPLVDILLREPLPPESLPVIRVYDPSGTLLR